MPEETRATEQVLREQADRCRRLSRQITDRRAAQALLDLAEEFERRAGRNLQAVHQRQCAAGESSGGDGS